VDDAASTDQGMPITINVLANDSDPDGDPLTVTSVTQASHGTVVNNGNGTVKYTPNPIFSGMDTFTYTISDGHGGMDTATVTVTIQGALVLQDDRNGNCLRLNLTAATYTFRTARNGTFMGSVVITRSGPALNFQSSPSDPNLLQGGVDLSRRTGNARYQVPRGRGGQIFTITDNNIDNKEPCL